MSSAASIAAARRLRRDELPHIPPEAAPVGDTVRLTLEAPSDSRPEVLLTDTRREVSWRVALVRDAQTRLWETEILLPDDPTLLTYHFLLADGAVVREWRQKIGVVKPLYGEWEHRDFQLAVYRPGSVPDWVAGAVVYQIFPDRFAVGDPGRVRNGKNDVYGHEARYLEWHELPEHPPKGRDFFGGDLRGIIDRLDYLVGLGVTCLYLTPIFAARTNHRYDPVDYLRIDPRLGDEATYRELISAATTRGMRVMLDGVFNHCSKESEYFLAAQSDRTSPYYRWFTFTAWPDGYAGWVDVRQLPELTECPEVETFFFGPGGVALRWLETGIAGWRLDVTPWLSDGYWRRFRRAVRDRFPDAHLVAEDWDDCTRRFVGDQFDATMNYRFAYSVAGWAAGKLTAAELDDRLETLRRDTPEPTFNIQWNLLGSHDTARLLTQVGGDRARLQLAVAFQLAYAGVPMIYYGDEAGIEGDYAEASRRPFPWDSADQELGAFYRRAIHARRSSTALSHGSVRTLLIDDGQSAYVVERVRGDARVVACFNAGDRPAAITVEVGGSGRWHDLLERVGEVTASDGRLRLQLPPLDAAWLTPNNG